MVVRLPNLPAPGETVLGGEFVMAAGGKGANQAVAASRLGAQVTFVARLGRDVFGEAAMQGYSAEAINVDHIVWDDEAASGVALVMVGETGQNLIAVAPGANSRLSPQDVVAAEAAFVEADVVLLQLEIPLDTVLATAELARRHSVRVLLNPAPATKLPPDLLKSVDVLTPNESEAAGLTSLPVPHLDGACAAAQRLLAQGPKVVIITLGARGAMLATEQETIHVPGFAVTAVDASAAGDAFNAALAVAWVRGSDLREAVRYANAAGAWAVTKLGAQPSLPTADEVAALMA